MADKGLWQRGIVLIHRSHSTATAGKTSMKQGTARIRAERSESTTQRANGRVWYKTGVILPTQKPEERHKLTEGKRKDQWSVSINDQYRICFNWVDGRATNVEITDYH
jgi:hypothetical protein